MTSAVHSHIAAGDLFCGVGGLTHGLERAGIDVVMGVDLDPACRFPFKTNNAAKFEHADVSNISATTIAAKLSSCCEAQFRACVFAGRLRTLPAIFDLLKKQETFVKE